MAVVSLNEETKIKDIVKFFKPNLEDHSSKDLIDELTLRAENRILLLNKNASKGFPASDAICNIKICIGLLKVINEANQF